MQKEEKNGVNFALVYGIVNYFQEKIEKGAYLSDGARNVLHETNFQEFLIKYFEFRRAYCILNIKYRGFMALLIKLLYPLRKILRKGKVGALLKLDGWSRGKDC